MTLEEKRHRAQQILELVNKLKLSFFGLNDHGQIEMNIDFDTLEEMRGLLDLAQEIGPEDGPTKRKLREAEKNYQLYMDQYNRYGSKTIRI